MSDLLWVLMDMKHNKKSVKYEKELI